MKGREFVAATVAFFVLPRRLWAQGKPRRLGVLILGEPTSTMNKALHDGPRSHGWIEGANIL